MRRAAAAFALVLGALIGHPATASTSVALSFDDLVRSSTAAVFVTPVTQTSMWESGRIVTYTEAHVDDVVAGSGTADELWVRTLGGKVGRLGQAVDGEAVFTVGRPTLVFVHPARDLSAEGRQVLPGVFTVTARAQGQFPVVLDEKGALRVRVSSGVGSTMSARGAAPAVMAADVLHGLQVTEVKGPVRDAWSRLHAP